MSITPIGGIPKTADSEKPRRGLRSSENAPSVDAAAGANGADSPADLQSLRAELRAVVARLDLNDEQALRRAMPLVIRSILVRSLGARLENHPEFGQIMSKLEQELSGEQHQLLWKEFVSALQ